MQLFFYNLSLFLYKSAIRLVSLWNKKAKLWLRGRADIFTKIQTAVKNEEAFIWVHCPSLGEFEQGRPVIESIKKTYPGKKILLTFFSPSGYEIRKNYPVADHVFYLPADSRSHAGKFLDMVKPSLVIFVKYDYWYYYLNECHRRGIPLLLVSAIFRSHQPFFKWYGGLHRNMLGFFSGIFVQDEISMEMLQKIGAGRNVIVAGDTRFDRVAEITANFEPLPLVESFCKEQQVLVAGSTWPPDEKMISEVMKKEEKRKLIIAPHEITNAHISELLNLFPGALLYSRLQNQDGDPASNILIIDNIGMLSRLYHYADITYIGGGFGKGIHNTLEAAVHYKPVLFGPKYYKFKEAIELVTKGGAFEVNNEKELAQVLTELFSNEQKRQAASSVAGQYVQEGKGATGVIMKYIQENRLLTS